jgi:pimeloyl-CoA dehydrogenase
MNFELTEDQRQLRDSVERLLADHYSFEARRAIAAGDTGYSQTVWQHFAALGLTALPVPEAHGGLGGSAVDALPVMEAFGRSLVLEPYVSSLVLGATALRLSGDEAQSRQWLPDTASGATLLAFAHDESGGRHLPLWVETKARRQGGQWVLDGVKSQVLHGQFAHRVVVTARIDGAPADPEGVALFLVDPAAPGARLRAFRLIDDTPAAELTLGAAAAVPLGGADGTNAALAAIQGTVNAGITALCGQALGAMQGAYDLTLSYLGTRQQFGRAIGQNQALRHRAAEMLVALEVVRSAAMIAAVALDAPPSAEASADLLRAKLLVGRHGRALCQSAVQLHGGIGMTEEYAVGHYLRKIVVIDQLFGDEHAQSARLAAALAR